jgi:pimeloyl-ACP methyl ester carboxylesterase
MTYERDQLDFYAPLTERADPEAVFRAPPRHVDVRARSIRPPHFALGVGHVEVLTFDSPFEPINPNAREEYFSHKRNRIARAQLWRHDDRLHPTMVVIHGFMAAPALFNSAFFSLPWFYGQGYDVLLVTLPFHGPRRDRFDPFSGWGLFSHGLAHLNEAILQGVFDVRVLVNYLLGRGAEHVGVTGLSLGGYTTAVLATAEPRLHFAIPNAAVTEMSGLIKGWFPAGPLAGVALRHEGLSFDDLQATLGVHSPLTYEPALSKDRLFIIGGLGDRLAPPEQSRMLWEHWDRCRIHWYPGNHIMHVQRGDYLREMGRFLNQTGFRTEAAA